ncbi:polysaccharide export protein [Bradyrhizobium sp. ISRA443]|uniref:polysaccharide biosynthesis/export family protein n=1 Tax=unclassified Bradyrhizobium TaxID=2631580 RepID=UPI00247A3AAF|nr:MULTISPECIES: polysaccharide biosynthesis/export family protein [unclassified Bradyrhizobium]WGR91211.1 polysaccharide export protein [Bradyrhizobium sp. ISRA435]WGS01421.1 polysaccharide export protein [Bradyrhizobium sp. ISRA436]WGS08308.1 polysaccharide export protein [Bradyrhizobium sp. ISRA437]WGS15196.1 polysaccharide export protein [Bradyrhizobium sp. ISRA443]
MSLSVLLCTAAAPAGETTYRLAPGDRITVTVFGQPELSGDVQIDDAGTINLPLAAPIEVKGLTVFECQKRINDRLLADGILRTPSVGVRIAELRPLYVLGDVRLPGAYPFRYGSTTQSAVALAGGYGPGAALRSTALSDYLTAEERVRQLTLQKRTMLVREARLEAQRDGQDSFSPPDLGNAANDKDTLLIIASEQDIFRVQAAILRGQIDLLRSQKPLLKEQIDANTEQSNAGKKQLDLIRQQIDRYGALLRQGLGTQNNDFNYRVLEANQEAAVWRLLSDVSRLQVDAGNLDFKIKDIEAAFKRQVATDLQQTRDRLNDLEITLPAAIAERDARLQNVGGATGNGVRHLIRITRMRNGHAVVSDADETTPVEPGDVIDVRNEMPAGPLPSGEASAQPPRSRSSRTEQASGQDSINPIAR